MYVVYVIQSIKAGKYYVGFTQNIERRFSEHQNGHSVFDRSYRPFKLLFTKKYLSKKDAQTRENQIKSFKGGNAFKLLVD